MRLVVVVACVVAQVAGAQPDAGVVVSEGRCTLRGQLPSRSLKVKNDYWSLARVEGASDATVEIDPRPAVISARVDVSGWHLDGYLETNAAVGPATPMWFGHSVVANAKTAVRVVGGAKTITIEPAAPWWLFTRLQFSATLRRTVDCSALVLTQAPDIEDPVDGSAFAKEQGLPWGPPAGLVDLPDAGVGFWLVDDEGQKIVLVTPGHGAVIPVQVVAREQGRAKVMIIDPTFAVLGWVDAAAVIDAKPRTQIHAEHMPMPKRHVCRTSTPMTLHAYNMAGESIIGSIDANAPFCIEPTPQFPPYGSRLPPKDLATRLYVTGSPLKLFPAGEWWVTRPAEMTCVDE